MASCRPASIFSLKNDHPARDSISPTATPPGWPHSVSTCDMAVFTPRRAEGPSVEPTSNISDTRHYPPAGAPLRPSLSESETILPSCSTVILVFRRTLMPSDLNTERSPPPSRPPGSWP